MAGPRTCAGVSCRSSNTQSISFWSLNFVKVYGIRVLLTKCIILVHKLVNVCHADPRTFKLHHFSPYCLFGSQWISKQAQGCTNVPFQMCADMEPTCGHSNLKLILKLSFFLKQSRKSTHGLNGFLNLFFTIINLIQLG